MGFRSDFAWGAATAAYQIEGAAFEDGKGPSIWDDHCHDFRRDETGRQNVQGGDTGDVACDFYHLYREDVARMKEIGLKAYRFSISWARVLPDGTGKVNEKGLDYYSDLVDALLEADIEPWITLFHWDLPQKLQTLGGWQNPGSPDWFAEYTRIVVERLSDRVTHWMTLNEPQCHIIIGHQRGECAPKLRLSEPELLRVFHHHLLAHGKAVKTIREYAGKEPQIGIAFCQGDVIPATAGPEDVEAARKAMLRVDTKDLWSAAWWLDPVVFGDYPEEGKKAYGGNFPEELTREEDLKLISQPLDFIGINAYRSSIAEADGEGGFRIVNEKQGCARTAFKWPVTPETLYYTPKFLYERYRLPLVITENGLSAMDWVCLDGKVHDVMRIDFMHRYLQCLKRAVEEGIDIRGYFAWSLMDNMEWNNGYTERFGLIYVDFETRQRILKDSAYWYRDRIRANGGDL